MDLQGRNRSGVDPPLSLQPRLPHGLPCAISSQVRACGQWPAALSQCSSPCLPGWGQGLQGGGGFTPGILRMRQFRTEFISHSGLKIPREISHPSRIVLFTSAQFLRCTAKFQRVPGLFCEFPGASRTAFFTFRGFLHDLVLNPMPQGPRQSSPFICSGAQQIPIPLSSGIP